MQIRRPEVEAGLGRLVGREPDPQQPFRPDQRRARHEEDQDDHHDIDHRRHVRAEVQLPRVQRPAPAEGPAHDPCSVASSIERIPALRHAFADAYFGELISGICDRAGKMGYKVILEQAKPEFVKEREHIEIFERRYVDGILALGCNDRHAFLKDFADGRYPIVVVHIVAVQVNAGDDADYENQ